MVLSLSGKNKRHRKSRRRGKDNQQALAQRLGGKDVGRLQGEDIEHPIFSVECKEREKLPVFLIKAYQQAMNNCTDHDIAGGKIPIVILHQLGNKHNDDLVVIKLDDFETLWNPLLKS